MARIYISSRHRGERDIHLSKFHRFNISKILPIKHLAYLFIHISQDTTNRISRIVKKKKKRERGRKISYPNELVLDFESRFTRNEISLPRLLDEKIHLAVDRNVSAFELQKSSRLTKGEANDGKLVGRVPTRVYSREKLLPNFFFPRKIHKAFSHGSVVERTRNDARNEIEDTRVDQSREITGRSNENECFLRTESYFAFRDNNKANPLFPSLVSLHFPRICSPLERY